jgi:hypothetical protein
MLINQTLNRAAMRTDRILDKKSTEKSFYKVYVEYYRIYFIQTGWIY